MKRTDLQLRELMVNELGNEKGKFEVIDIAKFTEFVKASSPVHNQEFRVCPLDRINSKFQHSFESMKSKVKSFIESLQGKVSIILFDFCIESKLETSKIPNETDFDDAIAFFEVCMCY
jgi:hypothetical protein